MHFTNLVSILTSLYKWSLVLCVFKFTFKVPCIQSSSAFHRKTSDVCFPNGSQLLLIILLLRKFRPCGYYSSQLWVKHFCEGLQTWLFQVKKVNNWDYLVLRYRYNKSSLWVSKYPSNNQSLWFVHMQIDFNFFTHSHYSHLIWNCWNQGVISRLHQVYSFMLFLP